MRTRDIITLLVCIVVMIGLCIAAGLQLDPINRQRKDMGLIIDQPEDIPPELVFATVATGAFRGLLVDVLWMRADKLKEEGQFFDARQLAEWITILQPRFGSVWVFQAWNMAYNISVAIPATQPDQRWRWVRNGYELLRDEAITKYNLNDIEIYQELARILQHKLGGLSDDCHKYYKLQMALMMDPLLNSEDNQLTRSDNAYYDAIANVPADWLTLLADPNVASLIEALKSADSSFSDQETFARTYLSLRENSQRFEPAAAQAIDDFRGSKALKTVDLFAKAYELRETWKLDPTLMREINQTYGPIDYTDPNKHLPMDWRHPDVHAIYWAVKGLRVAPTERDEKGEIGANETNTDRIVSHSLQNLFRNGKLYIHDVPLPPVTEGPVDEIGTQVIGKEVFLRPDLRIFDSYNKATLANIEKYKDDRGTYETMQNGHRNFLKNAVLLIYQTGHKAMAQWVYNDMRKRYPLDEFKSPLVDVYAKIRFNEEFESITINDAKEMVVAMLREAYFRFAIRDDDEAAGQESLAEEVWNHYQSKYLDENRIDLPRFDVLIYTALQDFLEDQQYSPNLRLGLLARVEIERPDLSEQLAPWKEQLEKQKAQIQQQEETFLQRF
ncbi:MAG: hypothetical protein JXM79_05025 [Sedimentisphaerales bacterium]|nr:hypothetical protein [Sedimentisphaerales bacterium]